MKMIRVSKPEADAARLTRALGSREAFLAAKDRMARAAARRDDAASDHWCQVGLLVVDAWKAYPPGSSS